MPRIFVTLRNGTEQPVNAALGTSLMQNLRDAGIDELPALCGGCCACATCHVYVDETFFAEIPPANDDEDSLLESSFHRQKNSRLSCQIRVANNHEGMRVTISPED